MEGRGGYTSGALEVAVVPRADEEVLEDEQMALWFIATTAKSQAIQNISDPSERKTVRDEHVSATISGDEQLRYQFE